MAGIYIPNAELPSGIDKLIISADGQVYFVDYINPYIVLPEKAIRVLDHGRLIDADAATRLCAEHSIYDLTDVPEFLSYLPTIIPAEQGVSE